MLIIPLTLSLYLYLYLSIRLFIFLSPCILCLSVYVYVNLFSYLSMVGSMCLLNCSYQVYFVIKDDKFVVKYHRIRRKDMLISVCDFASLHTRLQAEARRAYLSLYVLLCPYFKLTYRHDEQSYFKAYFVRPSDPSLRIGLEGSCFRTKSLPFSHVRFLQIQKFAQYINV